ncbi:unnamed protein product [Thelazia callipaeda]|uniref:WH2 domain-containing protein n=1 Tax=Thelazia callipaeda TaxID=103827 RepID=A0A0N5CPK9_THECL|nr:unnamed protein product [Thelazia callipaeda]
MDPFSFHSKIVFLRHTKLLTRELIKNSALKAATRQLDQMIDQARYRHHQHRNKFKEAIDYLDQIFEDFKNENDHTTDEGQSLRGRVTATRKGFANNGKEKLAVVAVSPARLRQHYDDAKRVVAPDGSGMDEINSKQVSDYARHSLIPARPKPSPREKTTSLEKKTEDVDISETIVLPPLPHDRKLRGERLDFTRRWLANDIKSWASSMQSKPDLVLGELEDQEADLDECSLGSCSAEIAAINLAVRKKKKDREGQDPIQNVTCAPKFVRHSKTHETDSKNTSAQFTQRSDPIKPQPVKARAIKNSSSSSYGRNAIQRVPSRSGLMIETKPADNDAISLKSISQVRKQLMYSYTTIAILDPSVNTLSRSMEMPLSTRKPGAFTPIQAPVSMVSTRGSVVSLPDQSFVIRSRDFHRADPILAVDALVAELELNTDQMSMANKRRSFPTGNDLFDRSYERPISNRQLEQFPPRLKSEKVSRRTQQQQQLQKAKASFGEMTDMLESVVNEIIPLNKPKMIVASNSNSVLSPFETINVEKLNPSKVEALQSIFENKQNTTGWHRSASNSKLKIAQMTTTTPKTVKDDENYHEINDIITYTKEPSPSYSKPTGKHTSNIRSTYPSQRRVLPVQTDPIPAFPVTRPPSHPPGSTNSSQTGGYYSSGSSLGLPSSYASHHNHSSASRSSVHRGSIPGKLSLSSRTASIDDEDDGFYDNILIDEKRDSRGSELDNVSIGSHRLPPPASGKPTTNNRLDHFLRKISASKQPSSAASFVSLNKVANEVMPTKPAPLAKSNSLSHDPWKKLMRDSNDPSHATADKRIGLGRRLKNSIFGSKKRLN